MRTLWIAAPILFAAASPSEAKSVHKEFSEAWASRDNGYAANFTELLKEANEAVAAFRIAVDEQQPREQRIALFNVAMEKAHAASAARGRGMLLIEFREFVARKPSAARTELWVQEKASELQREEAELTELQKTIQALPEGTSDNELIAATQKWMEMHGQLQGRVSEITLIDANLRSYFAGRGEEQAKKRNALAGLLGGLAAMGQQDGYAPPPPMPLTTRCNTYFSGTVCTTN